MRAPKKKSKVGGRLLPWSEKFMPIMQKMHKNHAKNIFHRTMKKTSTLRSSLKRRSKEYEVEFNVTLSEIRNLTLSQYGKPCRYCNNRMDVRNMVCDHIYPLSMGGDSVLSNLQMICNSCNTKKGPLTHEMYKDLLAFLEGKTELREYVLRKLAKGDVFN
jgi:5-methylcytosine-specific restriction endonuclease McrA